MSAEAQFWDTFFECLFFNAFSDVLFEALDSILEVLGFNFGHLGRCFFEFLAIQVVFRKMRSRAGESSKFRVLGSLNCHKHRTKSCFYAGIVLGNNFSKKLRHSCRKLPPKWSSNWSLSRTWEEHNSIIFTLGSTRLPKWCPMAPKVAPRVPKGCQNGAKMPPKVFKRCVKNQQ